ncbi:hypothetical protein P9112_003144 [Eukaryota sp. TZLM1-RC]
MDDCIVEKMLTPAEENRLRAFQQTVANLTETNVALQEDRLSISDSRDIFQLLHQDFPDMTTYTSVGAPITEEFGIFESAVLKVLDKEEQYLSIDEHNSLTKFQQLHQDDIIVSEENVGTKRRSYTERRLLLKEGKSEGQTAYIDLSFIPCTSVRVERLFSEVKSQYGLHRHRLSDEHLNISLFLKCIKVLWDMTVFRTVCSSQWNEEDELFD